MKNGCFVGYIENELNNAPSIITNYNLNFVIILGGMHCASQQWAAMKSLMEFLTTEGQQITNVFAKAGLDNETSAICKHQQRFGLDVQFSA